MSKQKQLNKMVVGVRQPSFSEGVARLLDITNVLGDDHAYLAKKRSANVINASYSRDLIEASVEGLSEDWFEVCSDFRITGDKIKQKYHKELKSA